MNKDLRDFIHCPECGAMCFENEEKTEYEVTQNNYYDEPNYMLLYKEFCCEECDYVKEINNLIPEKEYEPLIDY